MVPKTDLREIHLLSPTLGIPSFFPTKIKYVKIMSSLCNLSYHGACSYFVILVYEKAKLFG